MDASTPYLKEKGLDEINDVYTVNEFRSKVSVTGESFFERGINKVRRDDPVIEKFLATIPDLCGQSLRVGLLWNEKLVPYNGNYECGVHYKHSAQASQKSAHGHIEFFADVQSGTNFAIKVLHGSNAFRIEEVCSRLRLQHENIADVYGIIVQGGKVHILMEHAGKSLVDERAWFAESSDRMLQLGKQAFRALKFLHVKGYVHCDIKPDNLMVVRDGNSFILKVIDFGTCRRINQPLPQEAHTTWQYWPPEMWKARDAKESFLAEASMDVYAMSLTLYFVQMGSHLMMTLPKQAMTTQPELVKMMGLPESIPLELRVVMNHCLEVNKVQRCTAEEAVVRLFETERVYHGSSSSTEKYLANLRSIAGGEGCQQLPFINNLIKQSGSSKHHLAQVNARNSKSSFHTEVTRGPEAVRFERKTSKIFQQLNKFNDPKSSSWTSRCRPISRHTTELGESSKNICPVIPCEMTQQQYRNEMQGTYPYASLLEKLVHEYKTEPQNSTLKQIKEIPIAPREIPQTLGNFDVTKTLSSISRQRNRNKTRQKSYDRNSTAPKNSGRKFNLPNKGPKILPKVANTPAVSEPKSAKLWPVQDECQERQPFSFLDTKEDDMDCFIDAFDPEAFQFDNEDGIAGYMFKLVEKQEHEEGHESLRQDMDEMSLSGPEVNNQEINSSTSHVDMGIVNKEKSCNIATTTEKLFPKFDLLS